MASSNYTTHLKLSKWIGSDKPKRSDFIRDNEQVDSAFFELTSQLENHQKKSDIHVTQTEKNAWAKGGNNIKTTTYLGNGASQRTIALGYQAEFVFVFAVGKGLVQSQLDKGEVAIYSGVLTTNGCTLYASFVTNGISVRQANLADPTGNRICLNETGVNYVCLHR